MKITDIQLDSFGHWKGLQIPEVSPGITVVYGPNEAGKSTILHLIRAVLYGFSAEHHARFVPPLHPGSIGGHLKVAGAQGRFQLQRWLPLTGALQQDQSGDLEIRTHTGSVQGKHLLSTLLSGVDDAIFRNVFAVGLNEMQQLATLSDTEAAHQLYGLASGADRVSISDVVRELTAGRHQLFESGASGIPELARQRESLRGERDQERGLTQRWLKFVEERRLIDAAVEKLERRQRQFGSMLRDAAGRKEVRSRWRDIRLIDKKLAALGPLPVIPADVVQRIEVINQQVRKHRSEWEKLRDRRRKYRSDARQTGGGLATLMHYAEPIQQLQKRAAWAANLVTQVGQLKTRVEEVEFELQGEFERLGLASELRLDAIPLITDQAVLELAEPERIERQAVELNESATRTIDEGQRELRRVERELGESLNDTGDADLTTAWNKLGVQVKLLQQRIRVDSQMEATDRGLQECRRESHDWSQKQMLPWRGLMILGLIFSVGAVLMLSAAFGSLFGASDHQRWTLALIGGAVSIGALAMKGLIEMAAGHSAQACQEEMEQLKRQAKRFARRTAANRWSPAPEYRALRCAVAANAG